MARVRILNDVINDNVGALLCEPRGDGAAKSTLAAYARHQCYFARKIVHCR